MSGRSDGPMLAEVMGAGMRSDEQGAIVAPVARDLDEVAETLTQWLAVRLPDASDVRLSGLTYPRGSGQSAETILFDVHYRSSGVEHREGLVIRIKPTTFRLFRHDLFADEFRLMRALHEHGSVPVARVRWLEEDPSILGAPFFVMDRLPGRVAVSVPSYLEQGWVADATAAQRAVLWENCVRALAALPSVPLSTVPFLVPESGDGFGGEWDRWAGFLDELDTAERPLPKHREILRKLTDAKPDNRPEGIVWGDARIGNMLVDDDFRVRALMDWEQPSAGGALHDLGWWLINQRGKSLPMGGRLLPGMLDRADTIALWQQVTGLSTEGIDWYEAFAAYKMACLMVNLYDLRGQRPPNGDYAALHHIGSARDLLAGA
ncbi:aminoglycoside phosphotransferase (APT) family kinase protein [Prauserella sediminis]|uniref:Aminoglycoside phosphotransferase (APT) family kinase protein n=1 Tax=Prauserella sediminis TaxID=577680 RepID=A0A839XZU9_9PSEU|nr:phosphotransferase family protein [Prauserella sediminis]MBB3665566.1 aminoglycoside phosphotransferase (APT) family kinase protein [Prauserella sediminis]